MNEVILRDILEVTKEEAVTEILESDVLSELISSTAGMVISEGAAELIGNIFGAVVPGVNSIRLNYKQLSFEKKVIRALNYMLKHIKRLEENFCSLTEEMQEKFRGLYVEWLLDNLDNERQEQKVLYHVDGFINMMNNEANDNLMIMFFDTINQLTQLDIDVLKLYSLDSHENIYGLSERYNLKPEQVEVIKEKLTRLGLLLSKNDVQRDDNIDAIAEYLIKIDKEDRKTKPQKVKLPGIKKCRRSESYSITVLGRDFLKIISNGAVEETAV